MANFYLTIDQISLSLYSNIFLLSDYILFRILCYIHIGFRHHSIFFFCERNSFSFIFFTIFFLLLQTQSKYRRKKKRSLGKYKKKHRQLHSGEYHGCCTMVKLLKSQFFINNSLFFLFFACFLLYIQPVRIGLTFIQK